MNEKEIGGYFGLEVLVANEYYSDLIAVNNARCALLYLVKAKHYQKVYLPYFLCDLENLPPVEHLVRSSLSSGSGGC